MKGDRRKKREEIRRIIAEDERRRKEKSKKKEQPRKANYRKDRDGNIILWGNVKFSKLSIVVLGAIVGIAVFFYIISTGVGEMEGYIEPEFSFESCQENGFTADMCKFYYKFCREYADGSQICEYAETNPYVALPELGDKWTEEEQDFLPPTEYLPFFQYAEARSDSEPTCYTQACRNAMGEQAEEHAGEDKQLTSKELNDVVKDLRKEVNDIQTELQEVEKRIHEWYKDELTYKHDAINAERHMDDMEEIFEDKETAYRHALDVKVRDQDDIDFQKDAYDEYKKASKELSKAIKEHTKAVNEEIEERQNHLDDKNLKIELEDKLKELLDQLVVARVDASIVHREHQFVSITLSKTCQQLIANSLPTDCPTYRELRDLFDNTVPAISGKFSEGENDIYREDPKYAEHWKYYQQLKNWKIIIVDPDIDMMQRSALIEVMPKSFTYVENMRTPNKSSSIDVDKNERYVWHDVKYTKACDGAIVAPDIDLITDVVNHFLTNCAEDHKIMDTVTLVEEVKPTPKHGWSVPSWIEKIKSGCLPTCK